MIWVSCAGVALARSAPLVLASPDFGPLPVAPGTNRAVDLTRGVKVGAKGAQTALPLPFDTR